MFRWIALGFFTWAAHAQPTIPRVWDERDFEGWQTRVAGQTFTAGHFTEEEYYKAPVENRRSYPVYYPGREPDGYWEFLNTVGPKRLIEPEKLRTQQDWIAAGRRVFEELDFPSSRTYDPERLRKIRSKSYAEERKIQPLPDGTIPYLRWAVTEKGVALEFADCVGCHSRWIPAPDASGKLYYGPGVNMPGADTDFDLYPYGDSDYLPNGDSPAVIRWRNSFVPWIKNDIHERIKTMGDAEWDSWSAVSNAPGMTARWDGSLFYPVKIADLIGVRDRKYFDHTATHRHRGISDLMRYAALVSSANSPHFGPYDILPRSDRRVPYRFSDEAFYALALYIYSLEPPPNPNKFDAAAGAGRKLFTSNCAGCHAPPLYTNNKLTLAQGYRPTDADRKNPDVMLVSVGTDPSAALLTRKGTGFYKIPSLKGVWYRGHYLHDGSLASLEELFDPARLKSDFQPKGWNPPGVTKRAVPGHEFGLSLTPDERRELIAFLRTL